MKEEPTNQEVTEIIEIGKPSTKQQYEEDLARLDAQGVEDIEGDMKLVLPVINKIGIHRTAKTIASAVYAAGVEAVGKEEELAKTLAEIYVVLAHVVAVSDGFKGIFDFELIKEVDAAKREDEKNS